MQVKKRDSENTKNRILDVALKIFAKKGYDAATTREICEGANININLIYYYFGGKRELYNALIKRMFENQNKFMNSRLDVSCDFDKLKKEEKFAMLYDFSDVMVDFLYKSISKEQVAFFIQVLQKRDYLDELPPALPFISKLLRSILKERSDKEIFFELMFMMSQIAFLRLTPGLFLKVIGQDSLNANDIELIRKQAKKYIELMISGEAG